MDGIDGLLFQIAQLFLLPISILVLIAFGYSLLCLGAFTVEWFLRFANPKIPILLSSSKSESIESMELKILKELEGLKLCSRVAPMLGLVATMIPLGPALVSASSGKAAQVADGLVPAFSAVIVALIAASISFGILTVRRRWLLEELQQALKDRKGTA
jgi:biopolymer transport protein ExbB/TolQ